MVEPEPEIEEKESINEKVDEVNSNISEESYYAWDSDDSDFEFIDGTKVDPKV